MLDSNPFVGTWKLVSWEVTQPDGTIRYLYSKDVVGYLIYTADGYMSAEIMDPDRQQSDPRFPLEHAAVCWQERIALLNTKHLIAIDSVWGRPENSDQ